MSFLEILRQARNQNKSIEKNVQEIVEQKKVDKKAEDLHIYLGDAIVKTSQEALIKSKKLNTINSAVRLGKRIAAGHITSKDLQKCFKMQERFPNNKNWNYQLVGGEPMNILNNLLKSGVDLNTALSRKIER